MSKRMRIAYIAHPIAGDIETNLASLRQIIRTINNTEACTVPFCPYYADVVSLNDNDPEQRARGIRNGLTLLLRPGMVDELRIYGHAITPGMREEINAAYFMGINIIAGSPELYTELSAILSEYDTNKFNPSRNMH